jgi:hypothetical protein
MPVRSPPRDQRDVYVVATKSAMTVYNNLSDLPDWLSNALCVTTEGSGDSRRELYTDDDESLIFACAPAMIAGVSNVVVKGDLASRALNVALTAVPESERITEPEYWAMVEEDRPEILGALLNALVTGIRRLPTLEREALPRMATFAKFIIACETEFWAKGTFLKAYKANASGSDADVLENDAAVSVLRTFMDSRQKWEGTASQLLETLVNVVKQPEREAQADLDVAIAAARANGLRHSDDEPRLTAALREARDRVREVLRARGWPKRPNQLFNTSNRELIDLMG